MIGVTQYLPDVLRQMRGAVAVLNLALFEFRQTI